MKPSDIMRNLGKIYDDFGVMSNVKKHMLRTYIVSRIVSEKFSSPYLLSKDSCEYVFASLLLHDIGKLVVMDLETEDGLRMIDAEDLKNIESWRRKKDEFREKYGKCEKDATLNILEDELEVENEIKYFVGNQSYSNNHNIFRSSNLGLKLCAYSDQRVGPSGILSLDERYKEALKRYRKNGNGDPNSWINDPNRESNRLFGSLIEGQIFNRCSIKPNHIKANLVEPELESLLSGVSEKGGIFN